MSASARQRKHEEERLAFHFHPVLLIFVTLWPISILCVADMVHAVGLWPIWFVADIVVSRLYEAHPAEYSSTR